MTSSSRDIDLFGEEEDTIIVKTESIKLPARIQLPRKNADSFPENDQKPVLVKQESNSDGFNNAQACNPPYSLMHHQDDEPILEETGRQNGYSLYPTLQPWGTNNYFKYDKIGQLTPDVKFDSDSLCEYLYSHPLKSKLTIWIQRHPIKAPLIYRTQYGPTCRAKFCRPPKGPPNAISVGHYRIAIDELTGRFPAHKADTYIHAAFFHISCFEELVDLPAISREFDIRCEDRAYVNSPYGDQEQHKNRMLLEERRIPQAISNWIEKARLDPTWTATGPYETLNYVAFTEKFGLRPHRKKCTTVPGLEHLDIAHMGAPRPVAENSIWGGKRVKGLSVAELCALEGRPYPGVKSSQSQKRKRESQAGPVDEDHDHQPRSQRPRYAPKPKKDGNWENPIVVDSTSPSPTHNVAKPVRRSRPVYKHRARGPYAAQPPYFMSGALQSTGHTRQTVQHSAQEHQSERRSQAPKPTNFTYPSSYLSANILNASSLAPGAIIRTCAGEYIRNPTTGILEPLNKMTLQQTEQSAVIMNTSNMQPYGDGFTNVLASDQPVMMPPIGHEEPNYTIDPSLLTAQYNSGPDYVQAPPFSSPVYDGGIDYSDPVYSMYSAEPFPETEFMIHEQAHPETDLSHAETQPEVYGYFTQSILSNSEFEEQVSPKTITNYTMPLDFNAGDNAGLEEVSYYNTLTHQSTQGPIFEHGNSMETKYLPSPENYDQLFKNTMYSMGYDVDNAEWFPGEE